MAVIVLEGVSKRFDDGTVAVREVDLAVRDGEFFILVGPSGCGKSTLLSLIVGLEEPTRGTIRVDGKVVNGVDPRHRDMAMVFQGYALYPHMSVRRNLAFPLELAGVPAQRIRERVETTASLLGIGDLLERRPAQLSGGQKQRVAMGRAIVREPRAFLMDEPLSNLDARLRVQMRAELSRLHRRLGVTTVYVTHDQTEAMTLGDRIAVLLDGSIRQIGTPRDLYAKPASLFVAGFIGSPPMNLFPARAGDGRLEMLGRSVATPPALRRRLERAPGDLVAGIRPEDLRVDPGPARQGEAAVEMTVEVAEWLGADLYVHGSAGSGDTPGPGADRLVVRLESVIVRPSRRQARAEAGSRPAAPVRRTLRRSHFGVKLVFWRRYDTRSVPTPDRRNPQALPR